MASRNEAQKETNCLWKQQKMSEDNLQNFYQWLLQTKSLQSKSARDVISRLNRLKKMGLAYEKLDQKRCFLFFDNSSFQNLSVSIRSQLRRALNLYFQHKKVCREANG